MKINRSEILRMWPIAKRRTAAAIVGWVQRLFSNEKLLKDVFKRQRSKRVLLCHLPEAFESDTLPKYHSNLTECYLAARCFDRLGYSVDCSSRANETIDYKPYEIVYGINGNAFFGSFLDQIADTADFDFLKGMDDILQINSADRSNTDKSNFYLII